MGVDKSRLKLFFDSVAVKSRTYFENNLEVKRKFCAFKESGKAYNMSKKC